MIARRLQTIRLLDPSVALYLIAVGLVGFAIDGGVFSVLFNLYLVRLGYGPETIGLVVAAGQLVFAAFSLPAGVLGERWGARRMLVAGMAIMVAGCALAALADLVPPAARVPWLIANCVVLYLGLALFFVCGAPFIMALVADSQRSAIFGAQTAVLALAAFAGSLVGGFLPQALGAALGLTPDHPAAFRAGLLVAALALAPAAALVFAVRPGRATVEAEAPTAAGSGVAAARPAARAVGVVLMLIGVVRLLQVAGIASTSAFFNVYLDAELNIPTAQIGLVTAVGRLLAAPAALVTPLLTARMGERSAVFWSSLATALAMLPLALVPHLAAAGLTFVGVVGLSSVRYAASMGYFMALVPPRQRGAVAGVTEMAAGFSFTAMTFGGGYLIAVIGYRSLFLLGAALTGLGALVFALAFRAGTESRQQRGSRGASARSAPASGTTSVPRVRQGHREGELPVQAKERVLILCTANSARSQMAEGLLRALAGDRYEVFSAGARPSVVNPMAVAAMDERGIDIRGQHSKHLNEFIGQPFDYVITVCDTAAETCPAFPGRATRIHWSFSDPAAVEGEEARMAAFRQVRDAIEARLRQWLAEDR